MPFRGTANPTELAVMKQALEEHCNVSDVATDSVTRDDLAHQIVLLFQSGVSSLAGLKEHLRRNRVV